MYVCVCVGLYACNVSTVDTIFVLDTRRILTWPFEKLLNVLWIVWIYQWHTYNYSISEWLSNESPEKVERLCRLQSPRRFKMDGKNARHTYIGIGIETRLKRATRFLIESFVLVDVSMKSNNSKSLRPWLTRIPIGFKERQTIKLSRNNRKVHQTDLILNTSAHSFEISFEIEYTRRHLLDTRHHMCIFHQVKTDHSRTEANNTTNPIQHHAWTFVQLIFFILKCHQVHNWLRISSLNQLVKSYRFK